LSLAVYRFEKVAANREFLGSLASSTMIVPTRLSWAASFFAFTSDARIRASAFFSRRISGTTINPWSGIECSTSGSTGSPLETPMPHFPLRLEAELEQLDAKHAELADGFMQQLANRPVSEGTVLLCDTPRRLWARGIYARIYATAADLVVEQLKARRPVCRTLILKSETAGVAL
jgi:hypothetical protein